MTLTGRPMRGLPLLGVLLALLVMGCATTVEAADVAQVQRQLVQRGYDAGKADGIMGPKTRAAIRAFQKDQGLLVTGKADAATVKALQTPAVAGQGSGKGTARCDTAANSLREAILEKPPKGLPSQAALQTLVCETSLSIANGVVANDFKAFHQSTSFEFQQQIPLPRLRQMLSGFVQHKLNMTDIASREPRFTKKPAIRDGLLVVDGHYLMDSYKYSFGYQYVRRPKGWKLIALNVGVGPK